ncbi:hypothetical protein [Candidatus Poriferisocius sp.]|uniref:hypothetical protein n=1 Tax=Candidatus Poriferisocius sp. TaxID=3101276 RepID=UPI003B525739
MTTDKSPYQNFQEYCETVAKDIVDDVREEMLGDGWDPDEDEFRDRLREMADERVWEDADGSHYAIYPKAALALISDVPMYDHIEEHAMEDIEDMGGFGQGKSFWDIVSMIGFVMTRIRVAENVEELISEQKEREDD